VLALEKLREAYSVKGRFGSSPTGEDRIQDDVAATTKAIVQQQYNLSNAHLRQAHDIEPVENIMDAYLDQFLFFEADKRGLFPTWIKPADTELPPLLVYKWCHGINNLTDMGDK
jgi:pre-mRNA-processing factor 8